MPAEIYLVKVGMTMHEGTVEEWYAADGEQVQAGALLYRLETEKVNLDVDAETDGTVRHLVAEGTTLAPGDVVGYIYAPGEPMPDVLPQAAPGAESAPPAAADRPAPQAPQGDRSRSGRVAASPAARRLAAERGIDLATVEGTGPRGRITREDVLQAPPAEPAPAARAAPASPAARKLAAELDVELAGVTGTGPRGRITREDVQRAAAARPAADSAPGAAATEPLSAMRRTIGERMHASLKTTAQLTMDMEVAMDEAVKLREALLGEWQSEAVRVSYTDLVLIAAAKALRRHPTMNASLAGDAIVRHSAVHLGVAVALDEGLIVPVIHNAETKSLKEMAQAAARLAERARAGLLTLDDVSGGTFTVTSLGMFGVDAFTPILNPPEAGILGVGRIYDGVAWQGERAERARRLRLSLTWDHRVLDGAPAAQFLAEVRDCLEAPYRLLT